MNQLLVIFLLFTPIIGILLLCLTRNNQTRIIRMIGVLATIPSVIIALSLFLEKLGGASLKKYEVVANWFQLGHESNEFIFEVAFELGLDGFSVAMLVMTAVISCLAAIIATKIQSGAKNFYILLLLLEVGMLGVFLAQNLVLFFIFFEITLVPAFFLIGKWGFEKSRKAAFRFLIFNGIGSVFLLFVIVMLLAKLGTTNYTQVAQLIASGVIEETLLMGLFICLMISLAVKLPVFPLHSWLVDVHKEAPIPVVMIHAGILLKIGAYGMIKFGLGLFPEQFKQLAFVLIILGVVNFIYGAYIALHQTDYRLVLAYGSISHMGIVLFGIAALNEAGLQGAMFQIISHGMITALLFLVLGTIMERFGSADVFKLGGIAKGMPIASGFLLFGALASLGLPGLSGFISEFLVFVGLFNVYPIIAAIATLGIVLTAVYMLKATLKMTYGEANRSFKGIADMKRLELIPTIILSAFIIIIGVFPNVLANVLQETIQIILVGFGG